MLSSKAGSTNITPKPFDKTEVNLLLTTARENTAPQSFGGVSDLEIGLKAGLSMEGLD